MKALPILIAGCVAILGIVTLANANKNVINITPKQAGLLAVDYTQTGSVKAGDYLIEYANNDKSTGKSNVDVFNDLVKNYNDTLTPPQNPDRYDLFAPNTLGGYFNTIYGVIADQRAFNRPTADNNGNITYPLITSDNTVWLNNNTMAPLSEIQNQLAYKQYIERGLYTIHTT